MSNFEYVNDHVRTGNDFARRFLHGSESGFFKMSFLNARKLCLSKSEKWQWIRVNSYVSLMIRWYGDIESTISTLNKIICFDHLNNGLRGLPSVTVLKDRNFVSCTFRKFNICKITSWSITVGSEMFFIIKRSVVTSLIL